MNSIKDTTNLTLQPIFQFNSLIFFQVNHQCDRILPIKSFFNRYRLLSISSFFTYDKRESLILQT